MEDELHCAVCKQLFNNPVLLPCYHALCLNCAVHAQRPLEPAAPQENSGSSTASSSGSAADSHASSDCCHPESDKLSILSETDSGVVCNSRPNSYVGTPNVGGGVVGCASFPAIAAGSYSLSCPACKKTVYFDENGAHNLPKYRTMRNIVDRYGELRQIVPKCQLCVREPAADAAVLCEQCEVLYCDECRESCHPSRGPLAKHNLLEPAVGKAALRNKARNFRDVVCSEHEEECLSMYCMVCKIPVCAVCMHDSRHSSHDVQAINTMCKAQKTELSQNLQQLSEKARTTTEFIQRLKQMSEKLNGECEELERQVDARCDALIRSIERRRQWLIDTVRQDKETKQRSLKDHVTSCTCKLQKTTSLLQFCIEALKENDPVSFLQVGSMLIARVSNTDMTWHKDVLPSPRSYHQLDLTLDDNTVLKAIEHMNFIQMKTPSAALIITEECSAENNSVTIAWQPPASSYVEGYVLELDDGNGGDFREVYCGTETICTVDGLHFNCTYNARVKAFNSAGEGEYSEIIGLQTSEVAWFTFDPCLSSPELCFTPDNMTVTCEGFEHRVALGSVGFSRGVHYWEFTIDRFDADTDPSFGVARLDVSKEEMLGKDEAGWSMYIDKKRSWFMHCRNHEQRCDGGIKVGSTVGILLDLNKHQLSFFVNDEPQGPVAFNGLYGVFYPAVSVNRGVAVTLHTALDAPSDVEDC